MKYILTADDTAERRELGGKAAALAALSRSELPVPPWFVVSPRAFHDSLAPQSAAALAKASAVEDFSAVLDNLEPPPEVQDELRAALRTLCPNSQAVAVRSSALEEDAAAQSFAGQLKSFVFVIGNDVVNRVIDVWRSGFADRVLRYRAEHHLSGPPSPPAVLVQRMVNADAAGVAFAADPVSGRRGVIVVGAVPGLGTSLVSGNANADTWHVDRDRKIVRREIADKPCADRRDESGSVQSVALDGGARQRPVLEDGEVLAVAELARRASDRFGVPQDIEWAIEEGRLFLLQSRPITSLDDVADPDGVAYLWDNSNIVESYSGITTPLTFSFARRAYEEVYRQFCRIMGVPRATIESNAEVFRCMLGLIRGRVYYNLLNWYRLLAMLPGFQSNRKFMEQMMGVREGLPESLTTELASVGRGARLWDRLRSARSIGRLAVNGMTLARRMRRFYDRLDTAIAEPSPPLRDQRADELAAHYRELERQLLTRWDAPIVNDFFAMVFHGLLRKLAGSWCGDAAGHLHNDLLCGEGGMISIEPARQMRSMAEALADDAELVALLTDGSPHEILPALKRHAPLEERYQRYLHDFGDRCLEELKLESATLHDDPLPLLRGIGHLARRLSSEAGAPPEGHIEAELRREAERRARKALKWHPLRHAIFRWVLGHARRRVRDRENLRFERTRVFGRVRRIFVELGRRLHAESCLDNPRDVFYLEVEEVLGFVNGTTSTVDLRGLAALRKAEFARFAELEPPHERFDTRGIVHRGNAFRAAATADAKAEGEERRGLACCPGVVRSTARVVLDPRQTTLQGGEILVAPRTDPGWVMIFPSAAGLLVERGSLLSHSAIVAREMGIPAIVAIPGLTDWLGDGDEVEMDGSTGVVRRLAAARGRARDD